MSRDDMYALFYDVKITTIEISRVAEPALVGGAGLAVSRRGQQNASMTWDVYALRAPGGARSVEQIPEGYTGPDIGDEETVLRVVQRVAPHVDASDPRWLRLEGEDHRIEVALGKDIRVHDVTFYIGRGDGAVPIVLEVCRSLGITPFDTETGEVLTESSQPPPDAPPDDDDEDEDRPWWRRLLRR